MQLTDRTTFAKVALTGLSFTHDGHGMAGMSVMQMPHGDGPAIPLATYRPFGGRRPVNIAATYQRLLGGGAQPVIAAWQTPREVAFTAFGLDNRPQTAKRRV